MVAESDHGFTLIELMVVILVIAVLIAISIPTYLGARKRAQDTAAKTLARDALGSARTLFLVEESYAAVDIASLKEVEPNITFVGGATPSSGPDVASVAAPDNLTFYIAVYSKTGTCFWIKDVVAAAGGTRYARQDTTTVSCTASGAPADSGFTSNWA